VPRVPQSELQVLEEGEVMDLTLSLEVSAVLNELVVGLAVDEGSTTDSCFRLRDTSVTMVLP
jgi:hypothetical protein